ncbi:MAG TPA: DUF3667 domain-containing protein [Pyrinomonadaceae bacterium]|nr:DUF3667 domain-containing protein [Pyrinomonadaceae bacterium]
MKTTLEDATRLDAGADVCPNCGAWRAGEYCQDCGQRRTHPEHLTIVYFFKHLFGELTELDSKLFRTLRALLLIPGRLTTEYLADRKERYVAPVKLYLVISAIFFLLAWNAMLDISNFRQEMLANPSFQNIPLPQNVDQDIFFQSWFEKAGDYTAIARFASVIGLGLGLALLYLGMRRYFVEHLIFALHYYTFDFAFFSIFILLLKLLQAVSGVRAPTWIFNTGYLVLLWYSFVALRGVYRESIPATLLKSFALLVFDTVLSALGAMIAMGVAYGIVYVSFKH